MAIFLLFAFVIMILLMLSSNYSNNKKESDERFKKLRERTDDLRKKNEASAAIWNYYMAIHNKATVFEKNKKYDQAISEYNKALDYAYSEPELTLNNYSNSIHRLIILYGKTKQKDLLKAHLEKSILNNPSSRDLTDWNNRLLKIK